MKRVAARLAVALACTALAGCAAPRRAAAGAPRCLECHATHHVDVGACVSCHRGDASAARAALAHRGLLRGGAAAHGWPAGAVVTRGRALIELAACRRCHTIGGSGQTLAASLDRLVWARGQAQLQVSIRAPIDNMPDFGLASGETDAVIAALLAQAPPATADPAYRVWFTADAEREPGAFEKHCGGCHRLLTPDGPLGTAASGPNLSGLFSTFQPMTAPGDTAWTEAALRRWLDNPRAVRPATPMPRVVLDPAEVDAVLVSLGARAAPGR